MILAMLGASAPIAAQATVIGVPLESETRGVTPLRVESDAAWASMGPASLGPRRHPSLRSTSIPYFQERELAGTGARIRGRTAGALIGAVLVGAVGFAGGLEIDNIEPTRGARIGDATLAGTAGGALVGALLGGAVGWLLER
jgi:hypothetical protein